MPANNPTQAEVVKRYCAKWKDLPTGTLAKKLYKDHGLLFNSVENARNTVRYYRGQKGDKLRKELKSKELMKPLTHNTNPFKLPESAADPFEPYVLPLANNNILVISDLHIPYHDVPALTAAIKYGKENKCNTVIILGDLIDFHMCSRFEKDPRARSVKEEFDTTRAVLEVLRKNFPTQKIIWAKGNHCVRYEKWLYIKAPEIFDDSYYHLEERLRLNELKIELIDDNVLLKAGKLFLHHGHAVVKGIFAPVNPARGAFVKTKSSIAIGHVHQTSEHSESNLKGELIGCFSIGCLCDLHPNYDKLNTKHNHGFGHLVVRKDGDYNFRSIRIFNGKIL